LPFDARHPVSHVVGNVLRRLADDLDVPQHRIHGEILPEELRPAHPRGEPEDFLARLDDVVDPILKPT
jgi:hypothetical protein